MARLKSARANPENSSTGIISLKVMILRVAPPSEGRIRLAPMNQPSRISPKTGISALSTVTQLSSISDELRSRQQVYWPNPLSRSKFLTDSYIYSCHLQMPLNDSFNGKDHP